MKSIMSHDFATTPRIEAPRSRFDRSFGHKTTMDADWLVPLYWDSALPGDTFNLNATIFARLQTPINPIMDNLFIDMHYFFVPNRLLWDNWRKFCGEQVDPADSIDYTIPKISGTTGATSNGDGYLLNENLRRNALMNYMGVPYGIAADDVDISALPFRAYGFIYNEWFRDQNLIDSITVMTDDGPDIPDESPYLQRRGKRHDYFTSALPWPQKGDAISLPLGTSAPVLGLGKENGTWNAGTQAVYETGGSGTTNYSVFQGIDSTTGNEAWLAEGDGAGYPLIRADLTNATAATINDLREAFQVQKLLERDARAGTRYSEVILNHFGVQFYDVSYRPEFLGSSSAPINISPIASTANTGTVNENVGDLGAMGTASLRSGFNKTFVEHGIVMGIASARADLTYQQGLNRHFSHSTRYDLYWPSLAHLGEQAILNKEIYCDGSANDDLVFGYIPRYDEYRYKPSMITGIFQSAAAASLEAWHLSQEFSSLPTLGQTFIESDTPLDRCVSVPNEPHIILDSYFDLKCARAMPVNGIPGMIDHF